VVEVVASLSFDYILEKFRIYFTNQVIEKIIHTYWYWYFISDLSL